MDVRNIDFQPPVLWDLGLDYTTISGDKLVHAITTLRDHPEWVVTHETETRQIISLLAITDRLPKEAVEIQNTLIEKFPALFPVVNVKMGNVQRQIPKERLSAHSEKFKVAFLSGFKEAQINEISLAFDEDIDNQDAFNAILTYLAGGEVKITEEYIIDLMRLAQLHDLPMLVNLCIKFIMDILDLHDLDLDTIKALLNAACEYQLKDLKWHFITFPYYDWKSVEVLLEDKDLSQEAKRILYLANQCYKFFMDPHWSSLPHNCGRKSIIMNNSQEMETLRELHELSGIEVLSIYNMDDNRLLKYKTTEYLEDVSKFLPNLHSIYIWKSPVRQLPDIWLNNLKKIYVNGSDFFRNIDAPEAEWIEFKNCKVIKINAPKAKNVTCVECDYLTEVTVPQAKKIYLSDCQNLVTDEFPEAKEIELSGWLFKNLTALKAESVVCRNSNVKTIRAPNAKKSFHTCSIEDFEASLVEVVRFEKCDITDPNLPAARDISFYDCEDLKHFDACEAEKVYITGCNNLQSFSVAKGCNILGTLPANCKIYFVISKEKFKRSMGELIDKYQDRHQVLFMELSRNIASFSVENHEESFLCDLVDMTREILSSRKIIEPSNFFDMIQREIHDATITYVKKLIAPDSTVFESHERLNDALGTIACLLDECKFLTSVEKEELGQGLKNAITHKRPPMMLKTKADFELDDKFKSICGEIWYFLDLGEFKITFDEASTQYDEAIAHSMQEGDQ